MRLSNSGALLFLFALFSPCFDSSLNLTLFHVHRHLVKKVKVHVHIIIIVESR